MKQAALSVLLALAATATAHPQEHCSRETVGIRGTPVTITLCPSTAANAAGVTTITLDATYETKQTSFNQRSSVRFITGEGPARALQSVNLSPLGVTGVLHMTLLYSGNEVSMEHALLTPGAVTVK